jgi:hypothetical protein
MVTARGGVVGWWGRVVGPGATWVENAGTLGLALLGGRLAPSVASERGPARGQDGREELALRLLAVDLWGGAWCNNTPAAARWYHRDGQGRSQHLVFAAAHLHPFALAWLDRRDAPGRSRLVWALSLYGYLQVATLLVLWSRRRSVQRTAAVGATVGGVLLDRLLAPSARAPWFGPVYFVKLLAGHAGGAAVLPVDPLRRRAVSASPVGSCGGGVGRPTPAAAPTATTSPGRAGRPGPPAAR